MDITNEHKLNDPSHRHHATISSSERVIPEMVITSAEGTSEHETNVSECTIVLIPPTNSHSTEINVKDTSTEFTKGNSVSEEKKPDVDFEDISVVVKDVISKCTESVSHSVRQRPLRMELEKTAQQQENVKSTPIKCSPPPPPPPPPATSGIASSFNVTPSPVSSTVTTSPTAMQRPLVFEDVVSKTQPVLDTQESISVPLTNKEKEELVSAKTNQGIQISPEIPLESTKSSEECTSPTKKEGLHGVKKFFDSILHHDAQQPVVHSEEPESPTEISPETPKSGKSSIKKFFQTHKSDASKVEQPPSGHLQNETQESVSKQSKKSFDGFKHDTAESKESSKRTMDINLPKESIDSEKTSPTLATESPKTPSSFAKDTKQNIKAFFDTFRHEPSEQKQPDKSVPSINISSENEKDVSSSTPVNQKELKESSSFTKDTKQNIKTFFSSFKHESEEQKSKASGTEKSLSQPNIRLETEETIQSCAPESPKETKESSSFVKDTKQNIKSFFDTFKHEPSDTKHENTSWKKSSSHPDFSKEPRETDLGLMESSEKIKHKDSFAKSAKQNVKTFFDSFKHEQSAAKLEETQKSSDGSEALCTNFEDIDKLNENTSWKKSSSHPDFSKEPRETDLGLMESPEKIKHKDSFAKSAKQNVKTFFDSFKHEQSTAKLEETQKSSDGSEPLSKNLEDIDKLNENTSWKKSSSHPDFSKEPRETDLGLMESSEKIKHKDSFAKSAKQNVKTFFDSFKHEQSAAKLEETQKSSDHGSEALSKNLEDVDKLSEKHKEPTSPKKDTKQSIKSFLGNFKLGDLNADQNQGTTTKTISEPNLHKEPADEALASPKDTKHNMKTFFDNFKLGDLNTDAKNKEMSSKKQISLETEINKEPVDGINSSHKEGKHPVKKLFSFKQTKEACESDVITHSDSHLPKKSEKSKSGKIVKSVTLDLDPKYSNGAESMSASFSQMNGHETEVICEAKERAQSVPADPAKSKNIFTSLEKKSEVCESSLDSPEEKSVELKGSRQTMKKFFDSFKSDKTDTEKPLQPVSKKKVSKREKSASESLANDEDSKIIEKPAKEKKSKSIRRSLSDKINREEVVQNFKGFFDSLSHKSSSKKSVKDTEHIYDVVEVKPEMNYPFPTINISSEVQASKSGMIKCETQGAKKSFSPFHSKEYSKDTSKPESENIYISEDKLEKKKEESLPEEITHQKSHVTMIDKPSTSTAVEASSLSESPGSPKSDKNVFNAIGENILALKEKMLHPKEKRKSGLIEDSTEIPDKRNEISKENLQETAVESVSNEQNKEQIDNASSASPETLPVQTKESLKSRTSPPATKEEPSTHPNSLYDTCCVKLSFLLRDKALEIVSDHTKSPPPKPPKPSAETIAKARAAAIAKKIEAQKMNKSFGEIFPIGYDGMRFADDETESSCDYKDVENFDYITDYELINRYKIDSSKLDTFSVPSTCSVTSYYTADSIMETISLSSDISAYKRSTTEENKNSKTDFATSSKSGPSAKQTTTKKVPPPIPPKPIILQSISKVKEKPGDKAISQCVNGLSLSPRLQNKFSKDPAVTQKRPLLVADIKGTQFSSLQHPKKPQKPTRNFDTVLRNESLKKVPCVSSDNVLSSTEKIPEKDTSLQHPTKIEKRTISPPRPPPPNIMKKQEKPQKPEKPPKPERPPPPIKTFKSPASEEITEKIAQNEKDEKDTDVSVKLNEMEKSADLIKSDLNIQSNLENTELSDKDKLLDTTTSLSVIDSEKSQVVGSSYDSDKSDFKMLQDNINNNYETEKDIFPKVNTEISNNYLTEKPKPPPRNRRIRSRTVEIVPSEKQEERLKRSSSLSEIDVEKRVTFLEAEKSKFDSKSLYTTVNKNGKKTNYEITSQSSPDLVSGRPLPPPPPPPRRFRSLERKGKPKKTNDERASEQSVGDSEQITPLECHKDIKPPARKRKTDKERFLSLRTDKRKEISAVSENLNQLESVPSKPERKLKSSHLTKYDVNANISSLCDQQDHNSSNQSIPHSDIADSTESEILATTSISYQHYQHYTSSTSSCNPKHKKESEPRRRSHSNWFDEGESLTDSWEVVDIPSHGSPEEYKESPKVPLRRKLETKRKSRETSKFYINMEEEGSAPPTDEGTPSLTPIDKGESPLPSVIKAGSPLPLVDKETSPLPLDCSEKSVQTSLETLSQGIVSHDDDQSEDTDELLDLAQTLQKELSSIINRHKSVNDNLDDTTPSPPLSAATSEKNLTEEFKDIKKISSVRSSISEVWPVTSSDESDVERAGEDSSNISEISIKRKQKKIFYIAQEIMTSEEAFVDALKLLNVDFKAAVEAASKQRNMPVIPDETLSQIFNHLPQLQHLNENLLMELKDRIENWDKHEKIADIIVKMGPFLKLYSWYIHDFESSVSLLEECKKKYPAFAQTIKEFEMSAKCKKLALNHFMLKPIQRIPQYRLLLQEYLHQLTEDSKDYQDTVAALQIVSDVANHANESMKQGDNAQKLISIQNSIVGHKEIVKPGRVFIKEGELMKLSRKGMQPRWFILFNDLLLYLTSVQQGLYRINHELPLTGMKVAIPIQQDYQNEFSIISVTRSFTLAARSQEERQEWIIALTKAIEENASKRSTFTNSRLHQKAQDKTSSEDEGAFVLGKKAPVWIPDARVTMCQLCTSEFTVTFRRHHCRACGKVICSICSSHRISLPYLGNRIARVCDECHARLGQGSSACTESGETDSDNQQIAVKSHLRTDNRHLKKHKRSLPSVLKEVCANDQGSTISGYLHKKTGKSWKRDWFVVKDKVLYEYKASEDVAALKSAPLLGYEIQSFSEAYEGIDASLLFQLTHPGQAPIIFYADTVGSAERWVSALKTATVLE